MVTLFYWDLRTIYVIEMYSFLLGLPKREIKSLKVGTHPYSHNSCGSSAMH